VGRVQSFEKNCVLSKRTLNDYREKNVEAKYEEGFLPPLNSVKNFRRKKRENENETCGHRRRFSLNCARLEDMGQKHKGKKKKRRGRKRNKQGKPFWKVTKKGQAGQRAPERGDF